MIHYPTSLNLETIARLFKNESFDPYEVIIGTYKETYIVTELEGDYYIGLYTGSLEGNLLTSVVNLEDCYLNIETNCLITLYTEDYGHSISEYLEIASKSRELITKLLQQ